MPPPTTVITKQPNGSFVVRDERTYEELLKEANESIQEYQQLRSLYKDSSSNPNVARIINEAIINNNKPNNNKKRNPLWQIELQEFIMGNRGAL
ncbi:MAG: hypothetical protein ACRD8Z_00600 [Nitrososphaeraceae archaeon]